MRRLLCATMLLCGLAIPVQASPPWAGNIATPHAASLHTTGVLTIPEVGALAPDFTLRTTEGTPMSLSSYRGNVVVLTFWAFWCDTWREVRTGYRRLADDHVPAHLLAVAIDPTRRELLTQPDEAPPVFFPVLVDETRSVAERYGVDAVPTVLILDRQGRITWRERGWPKSRVLLERVLEAGR